MKKLSTQTLNLPSEKKLNGLVKKTNHLLGLISQNCENLLFEKYVADKKNKFDFIKNFKKIQDIWDKSGLPLKKINALPFGKKQEEWMGIDIPKQFIIQMKTSTGGTGFDSFILLVCKIAYDVSGYKKELHLLLKWALASGFNPNEYNGKITPVGFTAYSGQLDLLQIMHAAGADFKLELTTEHTQNPEMVGSTLLHRMAQKYSNENDKIKCACFLMEIYDHPLPRDGVGRTPLDLAHGKMYQSLNAILIRKEKESLNLVLKQSEHLIHPKNRL